MSSSRVWPIVRRVWIACGLGATLIFVTWSLVAYRASAAAREASVSGGRVRVERSDDRIAFTPTAPASSRSVGLLFFPGALVDPLAYAPLARAAAEAGFPTYILRLPRRGAFGGANEPGLRARTDSILLHGSDPARWVIAGHSLGGVVASNVAARQQAGVAGLILIGTSHPRDVDLSGLKISVSKIVGTRDGLASEEEVRANSHLLPSSTTWTWVEGGNHSQFGWYGFQPGDHRARISRADQQAAMIRAVIAALHRAAAGGD